MATNKKKLLLPHSLGKAGWDLAKSRDDIDAVSFPNMIPAADFQALLKSHGHVQILPAAHAKEGLRAGHAALSRGRRQLHTKMMDRHGSTFPPSGALLGMVPCQTCH